MHDYEVINTHKVTNFFLNFSLHQLVQFNFLTLNDTMQADDMIPKHASQMSPIDNN